jgi:hypothetical protein
MNTNIRNASLLALATLAGTANAQIGAYEGFNYPAGTSVMGQSGGTGFSTPWQSAGYGSWAASSSSMTSIRVWQLMQGQTGSARSSSGGLQRTLTTPIAGTPGTSVWISFVARHTGPTSSSWLGVKLPCTAPGADPFLFIGKPFGESNWGIDNGTTGGVQRLLLPAVQKIRCVARVDFRAGRDDVTVWTDPALNAEPALADAGLHLPAYGNFADLRKVLIETGSTGGPVSNSIDEVRIGSTYAEVTPLEAGHVLDGFQIQPAAGSSSEIAIGGGFGGGPRIRLAGNPGTPGCGGEIEMDSASGGGVTIHPGDLSATSGEIKIKHKGWDGLIYHRSSLSTNSAGGVELDTDLSGLPITAVRTVAVDGGGVVVHDETDPGPLGHIITNGPGVVVSGPCPGGALPQWQYITILHNPPIYKNFDWIAFEQVWVFGCPGETFPYNRTANTITTYGICDQNAVIDNGLAALEVSSDTLPAIEVSGIAAGFHGTECSGLGDVLVTERCDDGSQCDDEQGRKIVATNIGSSGQDGVEVKWPAARPPAAGRVTLGDILDTTGEAEMSLRKNYVGHVTLIKQRVRGNGNGSATVSCDFSGVEASEYRVTAYRNGSIVGETVLPNLGEVEIQAHIICGPGSQIVWGWVTELYWNPWPIQQSVRTYWGVLGCFKIGWGGNDPIPVDSVAFTPINPLLPFDDASSVTVAARDISEIVVADIDAAAPLCNADFNQDGFLDFFDYDDFVLAFETGVGNADFNGDGFTDFFDYDDFVLAFELGC